MKFSLKITDGLSMDLKDVLFNQSFQNDELCFIFYLFFVGRSQRKRRSSPCTQKLYTHALLQNQAARTCRDGARLAPSSGQQRLVDHVLPVCCKREARKVFHCLYTVWKGRDQLTPVQGGFSI